MYTKPSAEWRWPSQKLETGALYSPVRISGRGVGLALFGLGHSDDWRDPGTKLTSLTDVVLFMSPQLNADLTSFELVHYFVVYKNNLMRFSGSADKLKKVWPIEENENEQEDQ